MPTLHAKTIASKEVWKKGDRTIWEIILDANGQEFKAKTYSAAIAKEGFSGEVEAYEKDGRNGSETFIRQTPKDGGRSYTTGGSSNVRDNDPFTMYLSYAKDIIVAMVTTTGYDQKKYLELLKATVEGGKSLYNSRPNAVQPSPPQTESTPVKETFGDAEVVDETDPFEGMDALPLELE